MEVLGNFMESEYDAFSLFIPADISISEYVIAFIHDKEDNIWYVGQIAEYDDGSIASESYDLRGDYTGKFITKNGAFFVGIDIITEMNTAPEFSSIVGYC